MAGLRVLDLSTGIAGPYAAKLLVDAGADVIKLEAPEGDPLRRWTAAQVDLPAGEDAAFFRFLNASKRSVVADLQSEDGRRLALEIAATVDIVIETFGPGGLERRGLAVEVLQAGHPALSVVSLSHWGLRGPWAERAATEFTLQAACGATGYRGLPSRGPVCAGGQLGDLCAGTYTGLAAFTAWLSARRTGEGQHVDVSQFECMLVAMTVYHDLQGQFFPGPLDQSLETPSIEPASDGWVGLCTYTGQQWKDFCAMIGRPELAKDERFFDAKERMKHLEFIQEAMHAWTREHTVDEIIEAASLMRLPCAPIGDGRNVLERDHFVERGSIVDNPHGFRQPRVPYLLGHGSPRPIGRAPSLGEHDAEVRAELATQRPSVTQGQGGSEYPFEGLRVLDLTAFWAGPVVTSYFADMGADVVKVESIQRPDGMRFAGAVRNEVMWEWSPVFHGANPGKRDITLRLDSEEGLALLERLVRRADVVAENFSVRVLENFGIGWETLHEWNPRVILLRMPAWGLEGPWRDRTGFAPNVEQASGLAWITGYEDMPLIIRGACDPIGGMHAVIALLGALEIRERTGEGQLVEVPLVEPALNLAAQQVIEYTAYDTLLTRTGNRGPAAAPQAVYRCLPERDERDPEWLAIAVANDAQWRALVARVGDSKLEDAIYATDAGRRAGHDAIDEVLAAWCAGRQAVDVETALLAVDVPASVLMNAQLVTPNAQLEAREFFQTMDHPFSGATRYPTLPMRFSKLDKKHRWPAPSLGQHNEEVLRGDLELTQQEYEKLLADGGAGTRPSFM